MQKNQIVKAVSEKTALPTNQPLPTTPILQDLFYRTPVQKIILYL